MGKVTADQEVLYGIKAGWHGKTEKAVYSQTF